MYIYKCGHLPDRGFRKCASVAWRTSFRDFQEVSYNDITLYQAIKMGNKNTSTSTNMLNGKPVGKQHQTKVVPFRTLLRSAL